MRLYVAVVAAASLIAGFAVALLTGNRLAGGIVLLAGGVWCAVQLYRIAGAWRTVVVGLVYAASFALSPDGRTVVYVASLGGTSRLWLRSLPRPLLLHRSTRRLFARPRSPKSASCWT